MAKIVLEPGEQEILFGSKLFLSATRKMRLVTIPDAEAADRIFTVCMGEEVEPRREFIESNSSYANLDI